MVQARNCCEEDILSEVCYNIGLSAMWKLLPTASFVPAKTCHSNYHMELHHSPPQYIVNVPMSCQEALVASFIFRTSWILLFKKSSCVARTQQLSIDSQKMCPVSEFCVTVCCDYVPCYCVKGSLRVLQAGPLLLVDILESTKFGNGHQTLYTAESITWAHLPYLPAFANGFAMKSVLPFSLLLTTP